MISEQTRQRIRDLAARYPAARSAVMPALSITQQEESSMCLAPCGTAPILQVNDEFVEHVTLEMADAFIDKWKKESEHLCQN